jgi:putative DNA primase/helicase
MTLNEVVSRFDKPQRSGRSWKVRCPSHEDQKNSLSISEADNGKILLKCQAGCATKTVIDAVNLTWPDLAGPNGNGARSKDDPVVARYVYVDEQQKPLFRVCRTRTKNFFQERFDSTAARFLSGMTALAGFCIIYLRF